MQITGNYLERLSIVAVLVFGLILSPIAPSLVLAADTQDAEAVQQPATSTGVGVTGTPGKAAPAGRPALAPPPKATTPKPQTSPTTGTEPKEVPKAIGASAVGAGSTSVASSSGGGVSVGWKIAGAVLGVGLIVGLAGGGGGGGGGGTTPTH